MSSTDIRTLDERGQRILDAATRLILHYGYDKTTLGDIVAAASVSKSTCYLYWKSKDELVAALLGRETLRVFDEWIQSIQDDPEGGTLFNIYRHGFRSLIAHPLMRAFYTKESAVLGDYVRRRGAEFYLRPYLVSRAFVRQLQSAGLVRDNLDDAVINHVLMIIHMGLFSTAELIPSEHSPPFEAVADALSDMVQRAFAPAQPGDVERGKKAMQDFLEQLKRGPQSRTA